MIYNISLIPPLPQLAGRQAYLQRQELDGSQRQPHQHPLHGPASDVMSAPSIIE